MTRPRTAYEVLGVPEDAPTREIRRAYRRIAFRVHPDNRDTGDRRAYEEASAALRDVGEASDRARYDRALADARGAGRAGRRGAGGDDTVGGAGESYTRRGDVWYCDACGAPRGRTVAEIALHASLCGTGARRAPPSRSPAGARVPAARRPGVARRESCPLCGAGKPAGATATWMADHYLSCPSLSAFRESTSHEAATRGREPAAAPAEELTVEDLLAIAQKAARFLEFLVEMKGKRKGAGDGKD